jgi:glucose/arabinose dehydrogenase
VTVTTANGHVARWRPAAQESEFLAEGYDRLYGVDLAPGGAIVFAEAGAGRVHSVHGGKAEVLATGLREPMGVAVASDGTVYVSECHGGRVVKLVSGKAETVVDGLSQPHGLLLRGSKLYILDALAKQLIEYDVVSGARSIIAAHLPVGAPPGVTAKPLGAIKPLSGPMGPFSGITAGSDGTLYISADAEGCVMALRRL